MARCDQGYLCEVCGGEVEEIVDSDLYLAFVLGEVQAEWLLDKPERHIRCNAERAQYIIDPEFPPVECPGFFDKRLLDAGYVAEEEARVTRAWRHLIAVARRGGSVFDSPLIRDLSNPP